MNINVSDAAVTIVVISQAKFKGVDYLAGRVSNAWTFWLSSVFSMLTGCVAMSGPESVHKSMSAMK